MPDDFVKVPWSINWLGAIIIARELLRATDPDYMKRLSRQEILDVAAAMMDALDVNGLTVAAARQIKKNRCGSAELFRALSEESLLARLTAVIDRLRTHQPAPLERGELGKFFNGSD